jgi:hypothetical protein
MVASKKVTSKHKRVLAFIRKDEGPPGRRSVSRRRGNPVKPGDGRQQSPTSCNFYWFRLVGPREGSTIERRRSLRTVIGGDTGCKLETVVRWRWSP